MEYEAKIFINKSEILDGLDYPIYTLTVRKPEFEGEFTEEISEQQYEFLTKLFGK